MHIIGIPLAIGDFRDTADSPKKILSLLHDGCDDAGRLLKYEKELLPLETNSIDDALSRITTRVSEISTKSILLGGDGMLTYAAMRAFSHTNPGAGILVFDAYPNALKTSTGIVHRDTIIRRLIDEGVLSPSRIVLVGQRVVSPDEWTYLRSRNMKMYTMPEIVEEGIHATCDAVMAAVKDVPALYISVDMNVSDPAHAPGVARLAPAGMTSRELLYVLTRLRFLKNIRMADLVGIAPSKDRDNHTFLLATHVIHALT